MNGGLDSRFAPGSFAGRWSRRQPMLPAGAIGVTVMRNFYPKLIGGYLLFTLLGVFAGAAVGMFFMLASLPVVSQFPQSSLAPDVAFALAALAGIVVAIIIAAICIGAWQKRLQSDYRRGHTPLAAG
jgi:hypothetical protein